MTDVSGKFFSAKKVRTGVSPSSPGVEVGETLPPVNPPGTSLNSVGLTMPSAFAVANSPLTSNGTLAVTGAGTVAQYVRGDGSLADFPATTGGGASVSYYLNGSVSQGTIGGVAYREFNRNPVFGAGTDITRNSDGYIASFITDAGDPNKLLIPAGNWNLETYFSASSSGGSPTFYVELYKYDGTTFTLIASSATSPELIAFGTNLNPYFSTLAVPQTTLALTDRLALRYYVNTSGRTITLHTENDHLCQVITTFTTGLTALNGLTNQVQFFAVGTSGSDFNIASATATHTFNLPTASSSNRGALSSADWALFTQAYNDKINSASVTGTTTKTLTLTQQDGGTITASWTDLNTDAVISVFGRTGAVVAANGDYTTAQVTESGNLYYTDGRARGALSFAAGSGAYNTSTGVITIPTNNNQITNGAGYITSAALAGYLPLTGGILTGQLSSTFKSSTGALLLNSGDVTDAINNRVQIALGYDGSSTYKHYITTTHNDGTAVQNRIRFYTSDGVMNGTFPTNAILGLSIENGNISTGVITASGNITGANLSGTNTGNVTIGTANGLSLSGQILSLGLASGSANGALSSTDWTTFNNKQAAGNYVTLDTAQTITESKTFSKINSAGSGDYTNMTSFPIRITGTSGTSDDYWRIPFLSNSSTISGVFNFQTGKSVYWGEPSDTGTYFFRGRGINVQGLTGTSATFSGNVGTGGASATYPLTVYNASNGTTAAFGGTARGLRVDNDGVNSSGMTTLFGVDNTFFASYQPIRLSGSTVHLAIGTSNALTIASTGAATFSSTARVEGQFVQIANATNPSLYLNNTSVQWQYYLKSNNNIAFSDAVRDVLTLGYNGSPSFFQGGNVLIGTTTDNGHRLQIGSTSTDRTSLSFSNTTTTRRYEVGLHGSSGTFPNRFFIFDDFANGYVFTVRASSVSRFHGPLETLELTSEGTTKLATISGNVGIKNTNPQAYLDIGGLADTAGFNNLVLRSGNSDDASPESNQILFGYSNTMNYAHAIKTRHQSGTQAGNSIEFWVWKAGDPIATQAGQRAMIVEGNQTTFNSSIKTGNLDGGYVSGTWKLGRAVLGTQPSETYQIIVEINGALYAIGAANI